MRVVRVRVSPDFEEEPEMDSRSDKSGMVCKGGTNVVVREPEPEPLLDGRLSKLVMVLIDPVGERVMDWSGMLTDRSSASL